MKRYSNYSQRILQAAGIIEIIAGFIHFAMPYFAYQSMEYSSLNSDELNFITLCVFAVGILLIAFGAVTILLSLKKEIRRDTLIYYGIIKSVLWLARVVLEVVFPINITLFYIKKPTMLILPFCILVCLLFISSTVLIAISNKKEILK